MAQKKYSPFHSMMQRIAASKPGAWFYSRILHHFDRISLKLSGGRVMVSPLVSGLPVAMLTSTGAKTGLPRTVPLLYIRDEQTPSSFALIATNWGQKAYPAWYYNLCANPTAQLTKNGHARKYSARIATPVEWEVYWNLAVYYYPGYQSYMERSGGREIPLFILEPIN